MINVEIGRVIRQFVGDQARLEVEANSIRQLVDEIDRRYPGFREEVLTPVGAIRSHIWFSVEVGEESNYRSYRVVQEVDTTLPDHTSVEIDLAQPTGG